MTHSHTRSDLGDAAKRLRFGGLVAFPTETVYGLGADATSPAAVARIFAAKGRPKFNPLIAHVVDVAAARCEGVFTADAERLATKFWPGPLTLVLPRAPTGGICDLACAGLASVALRVPAHPVAHALLHEAERPIAAPSANISGRLSPTTADDVRDDLGASVDLVVDGGRCEIGLESTIIGCLKGQVVCLRAGGVPIEDIEATLDRPLDATGQDIRAPGMLASHYAPRAGLRLGAAEVQADEVGLAFAGNLPGAALDLSPSGDLREGAANLYGYLRTLDARGAERIAVAPVPDRGLGLAINDRLGRAAAPRRTT